MLGHSPQQRSEATGRSLFTRDSYTWEHLRHDPAGADDRTRLHTQFNLDRASNMPLRANRLACLIAETARRRPPI
jgi:hypothetical protein